MASKMVARTLKGLVAGGRGRLPALGAGAGAVRHSAAIASAAEDASGAGAKSGGYSRSALLAVGAAGVVGGIYLEKQDSRVRSLARTSGFRTCCEPMPAEVSRSTTPPNGGPPLSRPSFDLTGQHFIVTGGTQGLGLEIARQLKGLGATKLALLSRTKSKGEAAVKELTGNGCTVVFVEANMADPASLVPAAAEAIKGLDGKVDGLVNAAGTTERGNLMDTTVEMFDKQFDINTRAPFLLTQAVAKHWIDKKVRGGSVVNVSSIAAKGGAPFIMAYSASKAALNILTTNNAAELAPHGIRVNAVNMGWTLTDNENDLMVKKGGPDWLLSCEPGLPMKRIMRPVDVACTVCFLLSPASQMTTGNLYDLHPDTAIGPLSLKTEDSLER